MESEDFFKEKKAEIQGKSGVYVLESPMLYNGEHIYKIGYAHDSLYTRIRGYKTAYGPIKFKIMCAWNVPEGVFNKRLMTALQMERHLHDTLHKYVVMKKVDSNKKDGEWYYNINEILTAVQVARLKQIAEVQNVEKLFFYISDEAPKLTRSVAKTIPVINPDDQSSKFKDTTMKKPSKRNTPSKKYSGEEYELEHNSSRDKKKVQYVARVKSKSSSS